MIIIGIPTTGTIPIKVMGAICKVIRQYGDEAQVVATENSLVYDARGTIADTALKYGADLVFIDSDILFPDGAFERLLSHKKPIVSGLYYGRRPPSTPIAYSQLEPKTIFRKHPLLTPIKESEIEPFMEVAGVGMGFCLIRHEVLKAVHKEGKNPFEPFGQMGEDLSFLYRARQKGYKIWLDTTLGLKHIGEFEYGRQV